MKIIPVLQTISLTSDNLFLFLRKDKPANYKSLDIRNIPLKHKIWDNDNSYYLAFLSDPRLPTKQYESAKKQTQHFVRASAVTVVGHIWGSEFQFL